MPFFPVDDQAAFHPKFVAAGNAAVGLWTRAGSWSKAHAEGGRVPAEIARALGTRAEIRRLLDVGLWEAAEGGYIFHDWHDVPGNYTADEEKRRREANRERQRRHRDKQRDSRVSNGVTDAFVTSRPSPSHMTDVTYVPEVSPEGDVVAQWTDQEKSQARVAGINSLDAVGAALIECCGPMRGAAVVLLAKAICARAKRPVTRVDPYVITAAKNSPDDVRWEFERLDLGAIA
jgi:hypothetical protein